MWLGWLSRDSEKVGSEGDGLSRMGFLTVIVTLRISVSNRSIPSLVTLTPSNISGALCRTPKSFVTGEKLPPMVPFSTLKGTNGEEALGWYKSEPTPVRPEMEILR